MPRRCPLGDTCTPSSNWSHTSAITDTPYDKKAYENICKICEEKIGKGMGYGGGQRGGVGRFEVDTNIA